MSIICNYCKTENPEGSQFCKECGHKVKSLGKAEESNIQQSEIKITKDDSKEQLEEKSIDDLLFVPSKKKSSLKKILIIVGVGVLSFLALGIIASFVLVAIDPAGRVDEANNAGVKNDVSQVAAAVEAFFTNQGGTYFDTTGSLISISKLVSEQYLTYDPGTVGIMLDTNGADIIVYGRLSASDTCNDRYWIYETTDGQFREGCYTGQGTR